MCMNNLIKFGLEWNYTVGVCDRIGLFLIFAPDLTNQLTLFTKLLKFHFLLNKDF